MPRAGLEPACLSARDFKSLVATCYTTAAVFSDSLIICLNEIFPFDVFKYPSLLIASPLERKAS